MITTDRTDGPRFDRPPPLLERTGLWIAGTGAQRKTAGGHAVRDRRLDGYAVVLVERGRGWFTAAAAPGFASPRPIRAPVLLWLFPDLAHGYGADPNWHERWLLFAGPLADRLRMLGIIDPERPVLDLTPEHPARAAFDDAWGMQRSERPGCELAASGHLYRLLTAATLGSPAQGERDADPLVERACAWLVRHCHHAVAPEALARSLGVPYPTLRRRFRQAHGCGIKHWHDLRRMERACRLLAESDATVAAVAAACGYADPYRFSRRFHEIVGVSPSGFRERGVP